MERTTQASLALAALIEFTALVSGCGQAPAGRAAQLPTPTPKLDISATSRAVSNALAAATARATTTGSAPTPVR